MSQPLRRLIPQARTLITKESFRDQSFGSLDGYVEDILRPIDIEPLVRVVQTAMQIFPRRDEVSDGWLAPRVHASLRLFRSEAADQGIWDYLSVVVLRDYIIWRMAGEDGLVNNVDRIIGPFRHQAVARLWWAAELSRNGADYRPTEEAFSSQDAVNYLTNVDAFHNRPAALAYIRFIGRRSGTTPIKQMAIETGKTLNHVLTTIVLDSIAPDSGSDMNANERWIAEAPDVTLMDSALPKGPDEPQVPEEKIYAVEQLLERLMEEHRWHEVVDWTERWIAAAQSPELAETALPIIKSPGGHGSKDAVEKDVVAKDAVLYERFVEALRDDLGVEPSDQTRDLFEKFSNEPDRGHHPAGSAFAHRVEGLSKDKEIVEAMPVPGLTVSTDAVSVRGDETPVVGEPSFKGHVGSGDAHAAIVETAESMYEELSPEQQTIARRIFLQLTELGEGTRDTTRRVTIEELILRPENALPVDAMLKMLSDAHLITSDKAVVQIADEALIRGWKRLREWLDEDRKDLRVHRHLARAAQEWEMMQRDPSALYRGARLAQALEWAKTNADEISAREREFLDASQKDKHLTTNQGVPVTDNQNSVTVGARGPVLLQDVHLIEKLAHFDRERIPERVVHARGAGAHGYFQVKQSMAQYTCAKVFQDPTKRTPVFVRFSTVVGARGSADTLRDPRGFAVKFYTEEGNYDLVGNNLPVFFIRDAIKFPDMVHAFKPAPDTNIPTSWSANSRFWDFIALTPESIHMITWLFSDRGTVKSYRKMEGFGVNTYKWVNAAGKAIYVKYHWKPTAGIETIDRHESARLAGEDPDIATRDLHDTIASGGTVEYELKIQMMEIADELKQNFDPLDATKTWREDKFPLMPVGKMVLNRNPENYFAEVEQAAFSPASIVPGIELSADKLLQGRVFSYTDTQRYRVGPNYLQLPVNRPLASVTNNQRDGAMQYGSYGGGTVNYEPNTLAGGAPHEATVTGAPAVYHIEDNIAQKKIALTDDYTQAGERYRSLSKMDQDHLVDNIIDPLSKAAKPIQQSMVDHFTKADPELGKRVAMGLEL